MNLGKATAIFRNIYYSDSTVEEKKLAIETVLDMDTHNGITKQEFINALEWRLNHSIEREMIGDLISRRALKKSIHDFVEQHRDDDEISWTGFDWLLKKDSVIGIIDSQLISYDVDKVAGQLGEMKNNAVENILLNSQSDDLGSEMESVKKHYDNIIGIVKEGGVNG